MFCGMVTVMVSGAAPFSWMETPAEGAPGLMAYLLAETARDTIKIHPGPDPAD
jgi:hypothetical protein